MFPGLSHMQTLSQFNASACPPLLDVDLRGQLNCAGINRHVMDFIARAHPRRLYLHATWSQYDPADVQAGLSRTITAIRAHSPDTQIVVIGGAPYWGKQGLPNLAMRLWNASADDYSPQPGTMLPADLVEVRKRDDLLRRIATRPGQDVAFVSLLEALCDRDKCVAFVDEDGQVAPLAWDYGHLTRGGSLFASAAIVEAMAR